MGSTTRLLDAPAALDKWVTLVQAEYRESPGLRLTRPQIQRFWNLDDDTCDALMKRLESERFLKRVSGGQYASTDVM